MLIVVACSDMFSEVLFLDDKRAPNYSRIGTNDDEPENYFVLVKLIRTVLCELILRL